jgi:hypothetical protein
LNIVVLPAPLDLTLVDGERQAVQGDDAAEAH